MFSRVPEADKGATYPFSVISAPFFSSLMDHDDHPNDNGEGDRPVYHQTETFVFSGNGGPALLATVQNIMNRMIRGQHPQPQQQVPQEEHPAQSHPEQPQNDDAEMDAADSDDPPVPDIPVRDEDDEMPALEPLSSDDAPRAQRPIRPLPRPHAHFHAHTPGGVIDLFTFNIAGPPPPVHPAPPGMATFTFNVGPDVLAGFEAFFLGGMQKDREPDPERAKVLLKGMEIVPEGLVRRLERAGGVPGGQGSEETAGCAVCWGPLLDEVEPGEWDTAKEKEDKAKMAAEAEGTEQPTQEDDEFHGHIVALPCAHVYHAECLLPWFSRNTTCPTCRFDIDPESLTWTARPPTSEPRFQFPPPPPPPAANDAPPPHDAANPPNAPPPPTSDATAQAEQTQRTNATEIARLNAFMSSILRAVPPPPPPHHSDQPPNQAQPQAPPQYPQLPPQNPAEPPVYGPPPPPQPASLAEGLQQFFRTATVPLFVVPPPHGVPLPGDNPPPAPAPFHIPFHIPNAHPNAHPHPQPPPPRRERKKWSPPEPVGKTLRQRVEEKERELGLRCDDMVCGVAPSDEDPIPAAGEAATKRIKIRAAYDAHGKACEHAFHPACLVTSARVAGVTGDGEEDGETMQEGEVQVACPACRAVGSLNRAEWDEGVQASQAEMA